ncbi:hypothetical protein UlMin_032705 [Ulmus minor]
MEGFRGNGGGSGSGSGSFPMAPRINIPKEMNAHLMIESNRYHHQSMSPTFDSYSENLDINAPIFRYLFSGSPITGKPAFTGDSPMDMVKHRLPLQYSGSGSSGKSSFSRGSSFGLSPLSTVENLIDRSSPTVYGTPVKAVEGEEVLVIDEIPVMGGRSARSVSDSSSGKTHYKTEICHSREDSGNSRHSSKFQYAHGKEDLRPTRSTIKNKPEAQICKTYASTGLRTYSPNLRLLPQTISSTAAQSQSIMAAQTVSPSASRSKSKILGTPIAWKDWSPQDDGIAFTLPCSSTGQPPSREDVNAYIEGVLSGRKTRRLFAFSEIC